MNPRKYAGLAILVVVGLIIAIVQLIDNGPGPDPTPGPTHPPDITVSGLIGGKEAFFNDPDISTLLKEKYGLTVEYRRLPSVEMARQCDVGFDFCWPSNQNSGQEIKDKLAPGTFTEKIIFHTPIVFYSWGPVVDALVVQGIVEKRGEVFYVVDFPKLVRMMLEGARWTDIGLPAIYGKVYVLTSDPAKSTTGNSYVGLVANTLNCGNVVDAETVKSVTPLLRAMFENFLMPENNTVLWESYITKGIGYAPIITAIESNLIEYSLANPDQVTQDFIRQKIVVLYPEPTVLTSQPFIALTGGGKRLMEALRDPEIQRLGWEHHGFRPAVTTVSIDPAVLNIPGMRDTIVDSVIPMPLPAVMNEMILALNATTPEQETPVTIPSCLPPPAASPVALST